MQNSLVSVIVPAYQVENYIEQCVNSLLKQTYENLEILISCTPSQDATLDICKKLAETDSRVRVFENQQFGVSSSRNLALRHAEGEYIAFVDADDWVVKDYIRNLVEAIQNVQMSVCGFERKGLDRQQKELFYSEQKDGTVVTWNQRKILEEVLCDNVVGGYLWNKLFLGEIIRKRNLCFCPELCIGEDMEFLAHYIKYVKNARYVNNVLYYYRTNSQSALQKMYTTGEADRVKIESNLKAASLIRKLYLEADDELVKLADYRVVRTSMWAYFNLLKCGCCDRLILQRIQKNIKGRRRVYLVSRHAKLVEKIIAVMIFVAPVICFKVLNVALKKTPKKIIKRYVKG